MTTAARTLVLLNPNARKGRIYARWPERQADVIGALNGGDVELVCTTPEDFGAGIVRSALERGIRRIVVVGGDGTVSEAVQGFFDGNDAIAPDASLAILPAGRGDDFFKMLQRHRRIFKNGLEASWQEGLTMLRVGEPQLTDVGRVEFGTADGMSRRRYFMNLASFGYPGLVVQKVAENKGWIGHSWLGRSSLTYVAQSAAALREYRPIEMEIRVDGRELYRGRVFSGFVMNGAYNAGGACWSSAARIDDGLLHVTVLEPRSLVATVASAHRMLSGDWHGLSGAHVASGRVVEVLAREWHDRGHPLSEVDGDLFELPMTTQLRFEIVPDAIRLCRYPGRFA